MNDPIQNLHYHRLEVEFVEIERRNLLKWIQPGTCTSDEQTKHFTGK